MKIKEDSQAHSPLPDLWLSGAVLRVCDTDATISDILWALSCDRIDRWAVSIQSKSSLSCVGLGTGELVWPIAHGMCVTWITKVSSGTPQTHLLNIHYT